VVLKTGCAQKALANKTVACCPVVLVTGVAFLSLNGAIFKSENIHQSVEMKR